MGFLPTLWTTVLLLICSVAFQTLADVPCAPVRTRACIGEPQDAVKLEGVYVQDCFEEPCSFKKNQTVTLEMDIEFQTNITSLEARIFANIGGALIRWDGINEKACEDIKSQKDCPFQVGDYVTYGVDLFVRPEYPTVTPDVKFMLLNEKGETLVCWIVKAFVS